MDEIIYIVPPNKSMTTKAGVKGPLEEVTRKMVDNFDKLVKKGLIIDESKLTFKNDVEKASVNLAKPEKVIEKTEPEIEVKKPVELSKKQIKAQLKEKGIEYNDRANRPDLLKLLEGDAEIKEKPTFGAQKTEENE